MSTFQTLLLKPVTAMLKRLIFLGKMNTAIHGPHIYGVGLSLVIK